VHGAWTVKSQLLEEKRCTFEKGRYVLEEVRYPKTERLTRKGLKMELDFFCQSGGRKGLQPIAGNDTSFGVR